tara:strand:- start:236 stop:625 length:390 start_codon:yes stop_codon:yes gene_type:complete
VTIEKERIGDRVLQKRKEMGLTQGELAERVRKGMSFQNIGNLEQHKIKKAPDYIHELAEILDVTTDWLMRGEDSNYQVEDQVHDLLATDRPIDFDFRDPLFAVSVPAGDKLILQSGARLHARLIKKYSV